jgi:CheY-like chemotaxis protein
MPTTILIVEDDPVVRRVIEKTISAEIRLKKFEPRFVVASDGKKGLGAVAAHKPDLIITDLLMPGMDGFAFCRALRESADGQTTPLIVVSGVYRDATVIDNLTNEFRAKFVPKPIQAAELAGAMLELLDRPRPPTLRGLQISKLDLDVVSLDPAPAPVTSRTTASPRTPSSQGSIADRNVPTLLLDQLEAKSTGTLVLARGKMGKEFFIRDGLTVGAESNLRQEALGSLLLARGVIDENQLNFLLAETKKRGQKMGTVLVELGWLTPEHVLGYLAGQARKRIVDCLRWTDGTYTFIEGEDFADRVIEHDLEIDRLIFKGLQRTSSPDTLVARFDQDGARPVKLTPRFAQFRAAFESVYGGGLAPLLSDGPVLGSLILRPDSESLALGIEALIMTEMVVLGEPLPDAELRDHPQPSDSMSIERLGADVSGAFRRITLEPVEDLFADGQHAILATVPRSASAGAIPVAVREGEESGVVSFGPPSMPSAAAEAPAVTTVSAKAAPAEAITSVIEPPVRRAPSGDPRRDLLIEYLEIHGKTPHEVLGVSSAAADSEVNKAFDEKMEQFSPEAYARVDLAEDGPKLQAVRSAYQRAFKSLSEPQDAPTREPFAQDEETDPLGAELAFGTGLGFLTTGEHQQAVAQFEAATKARPDQAAYHAYLGWALYVARGDVTAEEARNNLLHALTLDPDLAEAHEFLGRVALSEGDDEEARLHLERTLELDPAQPEAVELLVRIYSRTGDLRATERLYRRVIAGLGERTLPLRRRLWKELADLYEAELGDRQSARISYEMAARLSPDDLAIQRKVVELNAADPARWRDICRALTAEWRQRPDDRQVGDSLIDLLLRVGRNDAATVTAGALTLKGVGDDETRRLADQHRPRLLPRIAQPFKDDVMRTLGYTEEDVNLEALFSALAQAEVVPPFAPGDLGFGIERPVPVQKLSEPFRRVLQYVCRILSMEPPTVVFPHRDLLGDARLADVRPYALLVGPALLESTDTVELGFRLGRAMSLATPGRIAGSSRSGRQLRPYLLAVLALARGDNSPEAPEVEAICRKIAAGDPELVATVVEFGLRVLHERPTINLSAWSRNLNRTATRVGLLVSGDPLRVGRAVAEEEGPESLDHLLGFVMSLEHFELREELGLTSVV